MALTPKQNRFVAEYLVDANATQAAVRAGYSPRTAHAQGSRLLTNVEVSRAVADASQRRSERVEVKADDILRELLTFARLDIRRAFDTEGRLLPIHEIPEDVARAISGIENEELFGVVGEGDERMKVPIGNVRKLKFWDKTRGLELLGKHLKMFIDRLEVKVDGSFADDLKRARDRARKR